MRIRILGLDPGIRNLFFAFGVDGTRLRYSLGEYRSHAKLEAHEARTRAWAQAASLPELPEVRRPFFSVRHVYTQALLKNLDTLTTFYGAHRFRHAKLNVRARRKPTGWMGPEWTAARVGHEMCAGTAVTVRAVHGIGPNRTRAGLLHDTRPPRLQLCPPRWPPVCAHSCAPSVGSLHAQLYFRRQSAIQRGVKRLTEDADASSDVLLTVVLYGDGSFSSNVRGSAPGSHTAIKRALAACATAAVLDTDERFSSKVGDGARQGRRGALT